MTSTGRLPQSNDYLVGLVSGTSVSMLIVATEEILAIDPLLGSGFFAESNTAGEHLLVPFDGRSDDDRINQLRYVLRWDEVRILAAVDPWPTLKVSWRQKGIDDHRILTPYRRVFESRPTEVELAWDDAIVALLERAQAFMDVDRGWAGHPHVPWIDDREWPLVATAGSGAYRTAGTKVLASRPAPTSWEFLLSWLAAGPDQPSGDTPREVVVTRDQLFARFAGGKVRRLPMSSLRARFGDDGGDVVYMFGRRTALVLLARRDCPVRAHLDTVLQARRL